MSRWLISYWRDLDMARSSRDTHPAAEHAQLELLRTATVAQRFARARSLTRSTIELARRAIKRVRPDADETETMLLFAEFHYGSEISDRVRRFLADRH
jgi:hypothetical protein